jgi:DNA repair protein RadA/Sms
MISPSTQKICFIGEIGLSGEVRAVSRIEQRISEAEKLGYEVIYLSKYNKGIDSFSSKTIELKKVGKVDEALHFLFA